MKVGCFSIIGLLVGVGVMVMLRGTIGTAMAVIIATIIALLFMFAAFTSAKDDKRERARATRRQATERAVQEQIEGVAITHSRIAGVSFRNTTDDVGGFFGVVRLDPTNKEDPGAIGIYRSDGTHVGFVPKDDQQEVRHVMRGREKVACVGYIDSFTRRDGTEGVMGMVKVINADIPNVVEIEKMVFVAYMVTELGVEFLPRDFASAGTSPHEWRALLAECTLDTEEDVFDLDDDDE